jgi:MFS family permease
MSTLKKIMLPALANMIELYDFTLFPVLLPIIAHSLFMDSGALSPIEIGYLAFAVSFLIVPFSSVFWGIYGDRYGGGGLMRYTLFIMAIPSLMIAATPSYQAIGIFSLVIIVFARILQGISASAEVLGSKIYSISSLESKYHILASATISAFGAIGVMLAQLFGYFASGSDYLFRIAFLIGALTIIVALSIKRRKKSERTKKNIDLQSVSAVIMKNKAVSLYTFTLSGALGLLSYTIHAFIINKAIHIMNDQKTGYLIIAFGLAITILSALFTGFTSLKSHINSKKIIRVILMILTLISWFLFIIMNTTATLLITVTLFSLLLGIFASLSGVIVIKSFSEEERFRGALLVNAFGVALFGGTAPTILSYISKIDFALCGLYLTLMFGIALLICIKYDKSPTN